MCVCSGHTKGPLKCQGSSQTGGRDFYSDISMYGAWRSVLPSLSPNKESKGKDRNYCAVIHLILLYFSNFKRNIRVGVVIARRKFARMVGVATNGVRDISVMG